MKTRICSLPFGHDGPCVYDEPPTGPDLRAACEAYLRENGWTEDEEGLWGHPQVRITFGGTAYFGDALMAQFKRDGIGDAS